jgi:hypothetical protein
MRLELERAQARLAALTERLARGTDSARTAEENLERLVQESDKNRRQAQEFAEKVAAFEREVQRLRADARLHVLQLSQAQEEVEKYFKLSNEKGNQLAALQATNASQASEIASLKRAQEEQARIAEERHSEALLLIQQRDRQERQIAALERDKASLAGRIFALEGELSETKAARDLAAEQTRKSAEEISKLRGENAKLAGRIAELKKRGVRHLVLSSARKAATWFGSGANNDRTLQRQAAKIRASGLFDENWYLRTYPDVAQAGLDPVEHYVRFGFAEGRNPSPQFDTRWYLEANADAVGRDRNALLHYIEIGKKEGRRPVRPRG